jgi:F-type H+-transporting ATPase subunit gamma
LANLRDIRKRIQSVTGTKKLTRAMKLVAASKLRRAQENLVRLRPYTNMVIETASIVAARLEEEDHPLLSRKEGNRRLYIILTSDKGLCGGFNANVLRFAESTLRRAEKDARIRLAVAGRKGMNYFRIHGIETARTFPDFYDDVTFEKASHIASWFMDEYIKGDIDRVSIVYNEFKSAVVQHVVDEQVLPVRRATLDSVWKDVDFIFEPSKPELLEKLLSMYTATEVYRAIMESTASEHGARMTAMENATNNAEDMIKDLTLEYNKARQASITKELMEIVGGSEVQQEG